MRSTREPRSVYSLTSSQNWQAHVRWTGPQIHQQLPDITLICAGMGTAGTMTGLGQYFKQAKPSVTRLGYVSGSLELYSETLTLCSKSLYCRRGSNSWTTIVRPPGACRLSLERISRRYRRGRLEGCVQSLVAALSGGTNLRSVIRLQSSRYVNDENSELN
jgi:hypothetical protein